MGEESKVRVKTMQRIVPILQILHNSVNPDSDNTQSTQQVQNNHIPPLP